MDEKLAWGMIRVSFRVGRELLNLLSQLKERCGPEEYKEHAQAIAGAMHGVSTALIDRALATHPELSARIEAELAESGRIS
jgi:1,6-anhydro-N-acetylmuramate kinase